jgi:hypothetical protein
MVYKILEIDGLRNATAEETTEIDARNTEWNNSSTNRKLAEIKSIRLQKLKETDWWVLKGSITTEQSDYRQALRDIPQNNSTEEQYDLLLTRDEDGNLTNEIWSKP